MSKMRTDLRKWARDNNITDMTEFVELDTDVMNGYEGVFVEGKNNDLPVILMLMRDPDYNDICFYIWINYKDGKEDTAIKILKSFTPN